jgi:hypothetical protein
LNLVKCERKSDSKQINLQKSTHLLYDERFEVHTEVLMKIEDSGVDKVPTDPAARGATWVSIGPQKYRILIFLWVFRNRCPSSDRSYDSAFLL